MPTYAGRSPCDTVLGNTFVVGRKTLSDEWTRFQRQLAETGVHIPIIFVTAHGDIPMSVRALKSGAVEFLTKPFKDQDLLDAIQQALQRDSAAREQQTEIHKLKERYRSLTAREREVYDSRCFWNAQ